MRKFVRLIQSSNLLSRQLNTFKINKNTMGNHLLKIASIENSNHLGVKKDQITKELYDAASSDLYDLSDYIDIPTLNQTGVTYNFGDDYYFYGNIKTDIQASIYVMSYKCNLGQTQFFDSSNPTWSGVTNPYVTEVGLYDSNKNLMLISKLQSPIKRQGVQQYPINLDF